MHLKNNNLSVIRSCINEILPGFFFVHSSYSFNSFRVRLESMVQLDKPGH